MQLIKMTWLSSYIGSWLFFQGAITPSLMGDVLDLGQQGKAPKASVVNDSASPLLSSLSNKVALNLPGRDKPPGKDLQMPWRLPNASGAVASVRIAESEQAAKLDRLSYKLGQDSPEEMAGYQSCLNWTSTASTAVMSFQVLVNEEVVAEFPQRDQAYALGRRLKELLANTSANPPDLHIERNGTVITGRWQQNTLFTIDASLSQQIGHPPGIIGVTWISALRDALDQPPLSPADITATLEGLSPTKKQFSGVASWYGPYFQGRKTANGEIFNQNEMTAAHPSLPFNTYLKVTNQINGRSVVVRINDRGPYVGRRSLDLSRQAARCLNSEAKGVVPYRATVLQPT